MCEREGGGGGGTHIRGVGREKLNLDVEILGQLAKGPLAPLVDRAVVQDHDAAGNVFAFDTRIHPLQNSGDHNVHELEGIPAANDRSIPNHRVMADTSQEADSVTARGIGAEVKEGIIRHHRRLAFGLSRPCSHTVLVAHPEFVDRDNLHVTSANETAVRAINAEAGGMRSGVRKGREGEAHLDRSVAPLRHPLHILIPSHRTLLRRLAVLLLEGHEELPPDGPIDARARPVEPLRCQHALSLIEKKISPRGYDIQQLAEHC